MKNILIIQILNNRYNLFNLTELFRNNPNPHILLYTDNIKNLEPKIKDFYIKGDISNGQLFYYYNEIYKVELIPLENYESMLRMLELYKGSKWGSEQCIRARECYNLISDFMRVEVRDRVICNLLD
jgi:hypothetical protein